MIAEMVRTVGHHNHHKDSWIDYIQGHLRSQSSLIFITLPNVRHIRYENDLAVEDYIRPIFTSAIEHLLGDHYDLIKLEGDDDYIFSGCVIAENRTKMHSPVASHLHLLTNIRDFVIDKPVVADRVICTLLNDRPDRPVEFYVPARHKLLESQKSRECFWTDEYRDKEKLFPDRRGGEPIVHYSIFQSNRHLNSYRTNLDLREVNPVRGFKSKDINVQIKPRQLKSLIVQKILAPYTYKNNENNVVPISSGYFPRNISDDINRVIPFQF